MRLITSLAPRFITTSFCLVGDEGKVQVGASAEREPSVSGSMVLADPEALQGNQPPTRPAAKLPRANEAQRRRGAAKADPPGRGAPATNDGQARRQGREESELHCAPGSVQP
jgi:hypothetical protein